MSSKKPMTKKEYDKMQIKVDKMNFRLSEIRKKNPDFGKILQNKPTINSDHDSKLQALDSVIGYLVRKGSDSTDHVKTLIDIANDYEKMERKND